jgi:hypothetical protein
MLDSVGSPKELIDWPNSNPHCLRLMPVGGGKERHSLSLMVAKMSHDAPRGDDSEARSS